LSPKKQTKYDQALKEYKQTLNTIIEKAIKQRLFKEEKKTTAQKTKLEQLFQFLKEREQFASKEGVKGKI